MTVTPRTNAIFVGLGATPTVPGTPGYVEISMDPLVGANVAFQEAIDSLPANGGVLYVMPGTADYVFKATVNVNKPNVTIDFVGGSTLTFASGSFPTTPDMFLVTQRGFRCSGARVVFAINSQNNS